METLKQAGQAAKISIRRAVSADIPQIVDVVRFVSGHHYSVEVFRKLVFDFAPDKYCAWLAFEGEKPVGLTMLQPCTLERAGSRCKAGYWTNLCVAPDYRRTALYPRLVYTMMSGAAEQDIDVVYAAVRRPEVIAGHVALGIEKVGEIPLFAKPLRPARLFSKFRSLGNVFVRLSVVPDFAYQEYLSLRRASWKSAYVLTDVAARNADRLVPVLRNCYSSEVKRLMTAELFAARYDISPDGECAEYRVLCVEASGVVEAAIVYRTAVRGQNIRSLVIVEMGHRSSAQDALAAALGEIEKRAIQLNCEVILCLSSSPRIQTFLKKSGYFRSNETYVLMKKGTGRTDDCLLPDNIDDWYFTFADHDAF